MRSVLIGAFLLLCAGPVRADIVAGGGGTGGSGTSGATTALDNLASVAVNSALLPPVGVDLDFGGSKTCVLPWFPHTRRT
jgi:hypothetical protein